MHALIVLASLGLLAGTVALGPSLASALIRRRAIRALSDLFGGPVDVEALRLSLWPRPTLRGTGVTFGTHDSHPARISIDEFSVEAPFAAIYQRPVPLRLVQVRFLDTTVVANGTVARARDVGWSISLQISIDHGRIEDVLKLLIQAEVSPLLGAVVLDTTLDLPAGQQEMLDRLRLAGTLGVRAGQFTSPTVQNRIDELSRRGQGRPENAVVRDVLSNLRGTFALSRGILTLSRLVFEVPGAVISLDGQYHVRAETLDLRGTARLDARLSQMTTGLKSWLLQLVDPLFARANAGTVMPIEITGTRLKPVFRMDIRGAITRQV